MVDGDEEREPQGVDDPRTGALLLSLASRLGALESNVRQERLQRLGAQERLATVVLDNAEATALIRDLETQVAQLDQRLSNLFSFMGKSADDIVNAILDRFPDLGNEGNIRIQIPNLGTVLTALRNPPFEPQI